MTDAKKAAQLCYQIERLSESLMKVMIEDRIDLEEAMTKLFVAFRDKYPRATHEIVCRTTYGDHLSPCVRVKSTF